MEWTLMQINIEPEFVLIETIRPVAYAEHTTEMRKVRACLCFRIEYIAH